MKNDLDLNKLWLDCKVSVSFAIFRYLIDNPYFEGSNEEIMQFCEDFIDLLHTKLLKVFKEEKNE